VRANVLRKAWPVPARPARSRLLGVPAPAKAVESPEDAGRADVEVLHRTRAVPAVPRIGLPEQPRPAARRVDVGDDLADSTPHVRLVPRLVAQRLEELRRVQHAA
jgi:hypothetical protein